MKAFQRKKHYKHIFRMANDEGLLHTGNKPSNKNFKFTHFSNSYAALQTR